MKRRLLAIAMTLAMALSLLPVTALAEGTEDRTGSEPVGSEQQVLTNEPSDEGATTPTDEESATDTETPVEDPEQGTEPEASADEAETATTTEETGQDDGITTEQELIDAISSAEDGNTITLAGDITLTSQLTIDNGKEIVLDLYGHTLNAGSNTISVTGESSLTIETSSGEGKITAEQQIEVDSASLTLNSGEIEITGTSDKSYGIYVLNNGFVTVNNGTINSNYAALAGNNTTGDMNFEVNGGRLSAKNGPAIYMPGQVQLLITNGTINGGISLRMGQVEISGGTINAVTTNIDSPAQYYNYSGNAWLPDALYVFNGTYTSDNEEYGNSLNLEITGGTFNCTNNQGSAVAIYDIGRVAQESAVTISGEAVMTNSADSAEGRSAYQVLSLEDIGVKTPASGYGEHVGDIESSITGGTFSNDVSEYVAAGYACKESGGNYVVSELNADNSVAQVDDEYYQTLAEAIEAAKSGETVTLLADAEEKITIEADDNLILDLNGHWVIDTVNKSPAALTNNGTITIKDTVGTGGIKRQDNPNTSSYYTIRNEGTMTITGGTVSNDSGSESEWSGSSLVCNGASNAATLNITGGTFQQDNFIVIKNDEYGTLNLSGGTVTSNTQAVQNWCNATISGGDLTGDVTSWTYLSTSATTTISGGDINGDLSAVKLTYNNTSATNKPVVNISGTANISGKISVGTQTYNQDNSYQDDATAADISITGGTFTVKPDDSYLGTGLAFIGNEGGPWTVGVADGMEADASASGGTASAEVGGSFVTGGEGNGEGVSTDTTTVKIDVTTGTGGTEGQPNPDSSVTTTNVTIAPESLSSVREATGIANVEIATDVGTLTVSKAAWDTITENAEGSSVTLSVSKVQTAEDNKPLAYELTATANGEDVFAQGGTGTIKVDVPYTGESAHVYYVGDNGAEQMTNAKVESGRLTWDVTHFSTYVVTQNENSKAFTVTEDDDTVTEYTDLKAVLDAIASNTINDEVVINLVQGSTHTVDNANYDIDQNVTINGANATIEVNVSTEGSEGSHHAFQIVGDHTLTLNGVTMNITETGTGTVGTYGIDVQYGSTLVLDNADLTISNVSNATISAGSGTNPGQFKILNGSTVTATDIGGNFSNGGVWTIQNSELDINGCASHGLSADAVTVDNSIVTITNAAYRGISVNGTHGVDGNLLIMNGSTVSVENCATQALGETTFDAVRVATATGSSGKGKLQVDSTSSLTLTGENKEIEFAGFEGSGNPEIDIQGKVEGATITGIVAEHNGVGYATLDAALTAAGNNTTDKTVTLLGDVETTSAITIPEGVTLDGNNFEIKYIGEGIQNGAFITAGGDGVIIQNATINTNNGAKHGVNFFNADNGKLSGVTVNGGYWTAVQVIGSTGVVLEDCDLNPTAVAGDSGKTPYANIEYGLSDSSQSAGGTIPSLTVDNVTFTSGIPQIWVDQDTVENIKKEMEEAGTSNPTNSQVQEKVNSSITNNNSDDIIVSIELTDGNVTDSTVDGTDDDDNGGGSHSGGSSVTRYNVTVEDTDNGSIRVSPSRASRGQTVTITVSPDDGYELDRLVVRDADGDRIDVERQSDTRYTFEMPRGRVTVEATFAEIVEEDAIPFRDVDTDDWFYDAVVYAYDTGLMSGVSDREFAPNSTLTRAMVAQMLWALEDKPQVNYLMAYDDVDSGAWFGEAVRWASSEGLMSGYSDTVFGPNDPVTREQLALILYNYARDKGYDVDGGRTLGSYLDADSVSVWAVSALEWAVDAGLISGRGEGLLAPSGTATRAEVAQIFMNFLENVAR